MLFLFVSSFFSKTNEGSNTDVNYKILQRINFAFSIDFFAQVISSSHVIKINQRRKLEVFFPLQIVMIIRFSSIVFLSLFLTCSMAKNMPDRFYPNRTMVPSRSIYDLAQLRIATARLAKAHRNRTIENKTTVISQSKTHQSNDVFNEHLKVVIVISVTVVLLMTTIVIVCIMVRYCQNKHPRLTERIPERTRILTHYTRAAPDKRNFLRKHRHSPKNKP